MFLTCVQSLDLIGFAQRMMDAMKAENEKLAAAGGGGEGDSKLQEMLAAKQAELMVSAGPSLVFSGPPLT